MDTKLSKTQDTVLNGIVRHILTALGGALVTKGTLAESELVIFFPPMFAVARRCQLATMRTNEARDCFSGIGYGFKYGFVDG